MENTTIMILVIIIIVLILFYFNRNKREEFGEVLGGLGTKQRKFYAKCVTDCQRHFSGINFTGQTKQLCQMKCSKQATERAKKGKRDLTLKEYSLHPECENYKDKERKEQCHCLKEIPIYCKHKYCSHSSNKDCMERCIKNEKYSCLSGIPRSSLM